MREVLRDPGRLEQMLTNIDNAIRFYADNRSIDFTEKDLAFYALVKAVEIVGEAAYMLTDEFKRSHPDTPWRKIVGMRHILVHGYYQIRKDDLLEVVQNDLPPLRQQIERYLKEYPKE